MTDNQNQNSYQVRAGSRTYFIDVGTTADGNRYLKITESRYKGDDELRERSSIIVFPEHVQAFLNALSEQAARLHV